MTIDNEVQPLWTGAPPGAIQTRDEEIPTLIWFAAPRPTGAVIVVCPGGGYANLADHEGAPVARWLNSVGVTAAVLRYRRAPHRHPTPLNDAARALRIVRHQAEGLQLDPQRVGILGFSAGGHLAATLSTHYDDGDPQAHDPVERYSSRPDLSILLYPVITFHDDYAHRGSRENLLGPAPGAAEVWDLSNENRVTPRTPPAFLFHTFDDAAVPVENSFLYARALRRAGVEVELHTYATGRHGVGLASSDPALSTWPTLCERWLGRHGFANVEG